MSVLIVNGKLRPQICFWQNEPKNSQFDLFILRQSARHEPGRKQSNLIRGQMRRLRQSLLAGQTGDSGEAGDKLRCRPLCVGKCCWLVDDNRPF
jgi:hypothetical protein